MSPEDEALWQTVLYVGLAVAVQCVLAAVAIQIWMARSGRATRKDMRDFAGTLLWALPFIVLGFLAARDPDYKPLAVGDAIMRAFFVVWLTTMLVSRLPEIVNRGTAAIDELVSHREARSILDPIIATVLMTFTVRGIALFMPKGWVYRIVALFAGCVVGMIWRRALLARTRRPDPERTIIKASS